MFTFDDEESSLSEFYSTYLPDLINFDDEPPRNNPEFKKPTKQAKSKPTAPKPIDCSKCRFKCTEIFDESERMEIFEYYCSLTDYKNKKEFILGQILASPVAKRKPKIKGNYKLRSNAKQYYLGKNGDFVRVCQNFFTRTLCISNMIVLNAFQNQDGQGEYTGFDQRGRQSPALKVKPEIFADIKAHVDNILATEPYYPLNMKKIYGTYKDQCLSKGKRFASIDVYRKIFEASEDMLDD